MIKILIADDHPLIRRGLKEMLEEGDKISVVCEADSGKSALENVRSHDLDLVILDLNFPDRSGLDVLAEIKEEKPNLPVLILTMHSEVQFAISAFKAGASGYLTKTASEDLHFQAIEKVCQGEMFFSSKVMKELSKIMAGEKNIMPHQELSKREFQVFNLLVLGHSSSEVAEKLGLGLSTVSTYRRRILEKMNLKTNHDLTSYAIKNNLT